MDDFRRLSTEEKLQYVTDELKKRVAAGDERIVAADTTNALKRLKELYPDLQVQTMGTWTKKVLDKDAYIYLIEQGIAKSVREACLEKVEYFESFSKREKVLLENCEAELVSIVHRNGIEILNYERCPWLLKNYYFVIDTEDKSPFSGNFWNMSSLVDPVNKVKIISKANLTELLEKNAEKKAEKGKQHKDLFVTEDRNKKLKRAMKLFEKCVSKVEQYMDKTGDYNVPTASAYSSITGNATKADVAPECAADFFDAVVAWVKETYKGSDYAKEADTLGKAFAETYDKILNNEFQFNGEIGVEYTVGLAVAVLIYVDPTANAEIEYVRDKWEFRGDYNASKRVCLEIADYGYSVRVHYNKYDAYDM